MRVGRLQRGHAARERADGQGLVEFALTLPIFMALMTGVLEFGFLYNNILTVQYASRQGVSAAARRWRGRRRLHHPQGGRECPDGPHRPFSGHDHRDLRGRCEWRSGPWRHQHLHAFGRLDCPGDDTQPYTLVGTEGYAQQDRKDSIAEGVDVVGVRIGYTYAGITPLGSGRTWTVSDGASLRMERSSIGRWRDTSRRACGSANAPGPDRVRADPPGLPADPDGDARVRIRLFPPYGDGLCGPGRRTRRSDPWDGGSYPTTVDPTIVQAVQRGLADPILVENVSYIEIYKADANGRPVSGKVNRYDRQRDPDGHGRLARHGPCGGSEWRLDGVSVKYDFHPTTPLTMLLGLFMGGNRRTPRSR